MVTDVDGFRRNSLNSCVVLILETLSIQVTSNKYTRNIAKELLIAIIAAFFLGFGSLFLLLWVGIYV
ncbi:hypothetical protein Y032_0184g999 [Ancylostoma ceylanicum]|uniref:Dolichyl-diphosphooligosaccharide-protein glycosyltransferase subunit TMEM258 n=1 Tax=Ancylostoma ceylanicum TaxID=53326 RepID=A0A016SRV5_9BILA|nr:hypothetical protein Y032_0184g999 [Ancylostoma ceylanicum]